MCGGKGGDVQETPEEIELARVAKERWDSYKERFIPVENKAITQVKNDINKPSEFLPGVANISTQQQFLPAEQQTTKGLTLRGAQQGSGAFEGGLVNVNRDRIASSALGQSNALGLRTTRNLKNIEGLISMGQGQSTEALSGLQDVAQVANAQAIMDARASAAARAAVGNAIGTGAGMYVGYKTRPQGDTYNFNVGGTG